MAKTTFWIELLPVRSDYVNHSLGLKPIRSVKPGRTWVKKPTAKTEGIIMELEVDIDDDAFEPVRPKAALKIEAGDLDIDVQADPVKITPRQLSRAKPKP